MTSRHPVKLVCVDLGGVVIRIRRSLAETLHAAGVPSYVLESIDEDALTLLNAAIARHQRGEFDCDAWINAAHDAFDGAVDRETILRAHDAVIIGEYPGVASTLDAIRAAGAATACLSNTNDRHWNLMVELPSFAAIDHQHASHLLGLEKPSSEIFRAFERATGFTGSEILFLDDLEPNCLAARACGWHAVRIDHERDTASQIVAAARAHGVAC